jgi:PAS domain S-box-containing protein
MPVNLSNKSLVFDLAQKAVNCSAQAHAILSVDGVLQWANQTFFQMMGADESALSASTAENLLSRLKTAGLVSEGLSELASALANCTPMERTVCFDSGNAQKKWYQLQLTVTTVSGDPTQWLALTLTDITELQSLRLASEKTKHQNALLFDCVKASMGEFFPDQMTVSFGPRFSAMIGDKPAAWAQRPLADFAARIHPLELARIRSEMAQLDDPKIDRLQSEIRLQHVEGFWVAVLIRGQVMARSEDGRVMRMSLVFIDVTELRHQDSRWRYRARLSSDWFWSTDEQGNLVELSEDIASFIGTDVAKLLNQPLKAALKIAGVKEVTGLNVDFLEDRQMFKGSLLRLDRADGVPAWIELDATPRFGIRGEFEGFEGVARDVTAKRLQELQLLEAKQLAEHSSKSKSAFLASMSHEIRTPMNGVLGMAEMLATTELDEDQQETLSIVRRSATHLLSLIDSILDFSKLDADRVEIEDRTTQLDDLVYGVCETLVPVAQAKGVRIRAFCHPSLPPVNLDDMRLRQVLNNLIGNAIKFSAKDDGFSGDVYVRVDSDTQSSFKISVTDNGIGIPADKAKNIFDPFTQAEVSTTRRFGGTGLGLAISKRLIELMGGRIEVASVANEGSTFTLYLPLRAAGPGLPAHDLLRGKHCVVVGVGSVEDDDLQTALLHAGATARLVPDLHTAVEVLNSVKRPTIYLHNPQVIPEASYLKSLTAFDWPADVSHLLITDGTRKSLRMLEEKVACVDWSRSSVLANAVNIMGDGRSQIPDAASIAIKKRLTGLTAPNAVKKLSPTIRVLVAEDDPINQRVIAKQLAHIGVQADIANTGKEALEKWKANKPYSLILTDLHMPEMDGYEFARQIRALEGNAAHTPVLALTANAITGETFEAYKAGIDLYLTKPIMLQDLYMAVSTFAIDYAQASVGDIKQTLNHFAELPLETLQSQEPQSELPSFDQSTLTAILGDDPAIMNEMLVEFSADATVTVKTIVDGLLNRELKTVQFLSHRLKSAARSVGALRLGEVAAELEAVRALDSKNEAQLLASELQRAFEDFGNEVAPLIACGEISK